MASFRQVTVPVLFMWLVASSLWVYPHSISYFNDSIDGPLPGPEPLLGSNVDGGQDLRYLGSQNALSIRTFAYSGLRSPLALGIPTPCCWPYDADERKADHQLGCAVSANLSLSGCTHNVGIDG